MASVSLLLRRIKDDLRRFLPEPSILAACECVGHQWRERQLGPVQTIHLFILQVLNFNTAMTHLRHLGKMAAQSAGLLPCPDAAAFGGAAGAIGAKRGGHA